jgi:hypothetical protein
MFDCLKREDITVVEWPSLSESCPHCNDSGWKQAKDIAVRCFYCCQHSMGYWRLDAALHNATDERYAACTNGCGHTISMVEYEALGEQE